MRTVLAFASLVLLSLLGAHARGVPPQDGVRDLTKDERVTWRGERRPAADVDRAVIHCSAALRTPAGKARPTADWFDTDAILAIWSAYRVGPHYLIDREGKVTRLVDDLTIAHHATVYNRRSIGIELVGLTDEPWVVEAVEASLSKDEQRARRAYTDAQYRALNALLKDLKRSFPELAAIRHADILDEAVVPFVLREARPGSDRTAFDPPRRVRLVAKDEAGAWYRVRTLEAKKELRTHGWVPAGELERRRRKRDPGAAFLHGRIDAVPFVRDDF